MSENLLSGTNELDQPAGYYKPNTFGGMNTEASLWVLVPVAFGELLLCCALFLLTFWLRFGELSTFAFGCAAFLAVLQIVIIVGLRFQNRTEVHTTVAARRDWADRLGGFWLAACALGALLGWICGQIADDVLQYRQVYLVVEIILTIVLPLVTMLPNARYISRNAAFIQVPILMFVTLLPMLVGIDAVVELIQR